MIKNVNGVKILTLSKGNMKLKGNMENEFLIWNIPAKKTCPNSTELCRKYCYAFKAERMYTNTRNSRQLSYEESLSSSFVSDMINTINYMIAKKAYKGKNIYFRIHESGDFYSREYLEKWITITSQFPEINFLAYTKSVKFVKETEMEIPSNFVIRYSIWADTEKSEIEIATSLNLPIYTAFAKEELEEKVEKEGFTKCECSCENCKQCYSKDYQKLAVKIH